MRYKCMKLCVIVISLCVIVMFRTGAGAAIAVIEEETVLSDTTSLTPEYRHVKRVYTRLAWATYLKTVKRLSEARKIYLGVLQDHEPSAFVHTELAFLSRQLHNLNIAEDECRRAIALQPDKPKPHFLLGQILVQRLQQSRRSNDGWDEVMAEFLKVVELEPNHVEAHRYLGEIAKATRDYERAIHAFKELTRIMPYYPQFYLELGGLYEQLRDGEEAIAAYERAVKVDRSLLEGHERLGELYFEQFDRVVNQPSATTEHWRSAKESLENGIVAYEQIRVLVDPKQALGYDALLMESRVRLGSLCIELGLEQEAVEILHGILDVYPDNVDANYWIGIAYQKLGNFEGALPYLDKAITLAPERVVGYYFSLERYREAIDILSGVLEDEPENVQANYWTGLAYQGLGDFQKTEFFLRETVLLAPEHEAAHNALGYFFAENGVNLDEAVQLISKALMQSPENAAYLDSLGWAYFKQGKLDQALRQLEKATHFMPENAEIQEHLGDAYMKKGLRQKAMAAWRRAMQLEPNDVTIQEKLGIYQERER